MTDHKPMAALHRIASLRHHTTALLTGRVSRLWTFFNRETGRGDRMSSGSYAPLLSESNGEDETDEKEQRDDAIDADAEVVGEVHERAMPDSAATPPSMNSSASTSQPRDSFLEPGGDGEEKREETQGPFSPSASFETPAFPPRPSSYHFPPTSAAHSISLDTCALRTELDETSSHLPRSTRTAEHLRQRITALENDLADRDARIHDLHITVTALSARLAASDQQVARLTRDLAIFEHEGRKLRRAAAVDKVVIERLKGRRRAWMGERERRRLAGEVEELTRIVVRAQEELMGKEAECRQLREAMGRALAR